MAIVGQFVWVFQLTSGVALGACGSFGSVDVLLLIEQTEGPASEIAQRHRSPKLG
jgi:hypothetical protein